MSIHSRVEKEDVLCMCIHIYIVEYYSAIKKNEIRLFAATWTDLGNVIPSEINQTEMEKYHMTSFICGI